MTGGGRSRLRRLVAAGAALLTIAVAAVDRAVAPWQERDLGVGAALHAIDRPIL